MPYAINNYFGTQVATVADGTVNKNFSIRFIGKNYSGFGEYINENFLHLLENFAGTTAPKETPVTGQLWYDSTASLLKLKYYTGTKWSSLAVNNITTTANSVAPSDSKVGDFWYDQQTNRLSIYTGSEYVLVGQQSVLGFNSTQLESTSVKPIDSANKKAIIKASVNGIVSYVISSNAEFTLDGVVNAIDGFTVIKPGITLRNSSTGVTSSNDRFWGTASNSDKLGGLAANAYALASGGTFTSAVSFADTGFTVGTELKIFNDQSTEPTIQNLIGNKIIFKTRYNNADVTPLQIVDRDLLPGVNNFTNLGSPSLKFANIYAGSIYGISEKADSLNVGGVYRTASTASGPNTIVVRDGSGVIAGSVQSANEAVKLKNPRNINGVTFDGTQSIEIPFDASLLGGTTIKSTVVNSSLTSVGTLTNLRTSGYMKMPVYTNETARNSSITSPEEGMVIFLSSTKRFQGFNGTSWVDLH